MSSEGERCKWSVYENVKEGISAAPEALMDDINAAISAIEYARAAAFLRSPPPKNTDKKLTRVV